MRDDVVMAIEERVERLLASYRRLAIDNARLQARVSELEERQRQAVARIDALLQQVQTG